MRSAFFLALLPLALAASFAQADDLNNASDGGHTHLPVAQDLKSPSSVPTGSASPAARPAAPAVSVHAAAPASAAPEPQTVGDASGWGYTYWVPGP